MTVWYDVPRFSERDPSQKGPTCWYYASKMLLKFHDLFYRKAHPGAQAVHPGLQMMHELRKVTTPMPDHVRTHADVVSHLKEQQRRLDQAREALRAHDAPRSPRTAEDTFKAHFQRVKLTQDIARLEGETARPELMQHLEASPKLGLHLSTPDFLAYSVPSVEFQWLTRPPTPADLEAMLRCYGPVYASGYLSRLKTRAGNGARQAVDGHVVDAVEDLSPDGDRHAVVIAGVTSFGQIWYKDPNWSDVYQRIEFDKFMADQRLSFLAVKCFRDKGPCPHLEGRLILSMA